MTGVQLDHCHSTHREVEALRICCTSSSSSSSSQAPFPTKPGQLSDAFQLFSGTRGSLANLIRRRVGNSCLPQAPEHVVPRRQRRGRTAALPTSLLLAAAACILLVARAPAAIAFEVIPSTFMISGLSADTTHAPFYHGVASADPGEDSIVLWTRRTPDGAPATYVADENSNESYALTYFVYLLQDETRDPISSGTISAHASADFTAAALVEGLAPNTRYSYWFVDELTGAESSVGETRTAGGSASNLKVIVSSCSSIWSGSLSAYDEIAKQNDINLVIHLGDYIYDYVDKDEAVRVPSAIADSETADASVYNMEAIDSMALGAGSLTGFRRVHSLHLLDPSLRAARQKHPFLVIWDNHDLGNSFESSDYDYTRVGLAQRAFREWVPNRRLRFSGDTEVYQAVSYGGLLDIIAIDILTHRGTDEDGSKRIMDEEQWVWLGSQFADSMGRATTWRLVANQNMFVPWSSSGMANAMAVHLFTWMLFLLLGLAALCVFWPCLRVCICCNKRCACGVGVGSSFQPNSGSGPQPTQVPPSSSAGSGDLNLKANQVAPDSDRPGPSPSKTCCGCGLCARTSCCLFVVLFYIGAAAALCMVTSSAEDSNEVMRSKKGVLDVTSWDGYPTERVRFLDLLRDGGVDNTMVLSGDSHIGWAADLTSEAAWVEEGLGAEFGSNSISRGNVDEEIGGFLTSLALPVVASLLQACNPHWIHADYTKHGFGVLDITSERIEVTQYWVDFQSAGKTVSTNVPLRMYTGENRWRDL